MIEIQFGFSRRLKPKPYASYPILHISNEVTQFAHLFERFLIVNFQFIFEASVLPLSFHSILIEF